MESITSISRLLLIWALSVHCTRGTSDAESTTQRGMVHSYTTVYLYGILSDSYSNSGISSATLTSTIRYLFLYALYSMNQCSPERACDCEEVTCFRDHFFLPCGSISESYVGPVQPYSIIRVPDRFYLNITLLSMDSQRYGIDCVVSDHLRLVFEDWKQIDEICGKRPSQYYYAMDNKVWAVWYTALPYNRDASYCIAYQAMSKSHVLVAEKFVAWDVYTETACQKYPQECLMAKHMFNGPPVKSIFAQDNSWLYTWYINGEVLHTPTVTVTTLECGQQGHEKLALSSRLQITDGPFSPLDPYFTSNLFRRVLDHRCDASLPLSFFSGSIGDLTVQARFYNSANFKINLSFALTNLHCQEPVLCSHHKIHDDAQLAVAALSSNYTSQRRLLLSLKDTGDGFLKMTDMKFSYDGMAYLPCVTGGIFIYELDGDTASLVSRICSTWLSVVWSTNNKEGATDSLYFSYRPILFVIKAYQNTGSGSVYGRVQLSTCEGILNPITITGQSNKKHYNRTTLRTSPLGATIRHSKHCSVVQVILSDHSVSWGDREVYTVYFKSIWQDKSTRLLTWGSLSGCFDAPQALTDTALLGYRYAGCNYLKLLFGKPVKHVTPLETPKSLLAEQGCFKYVQAFPTGMWGLQLDSVCLLHGLKLNVLLTGKGITDVDCRDSSLVQQWVASQSFQGENTAVVPAVSCGTIPLSSHTIRFDLMFPQVFTSMGRCCFVRIMLRTTSFFEEIVKYINLLEVYTSPNRKRSLGSKAYKWKFGLSDKPDYSNSKTNGAKQTADFVISLTSNSMFTQIEADIIGLESHSRKYQHNVFNITFHYLPLLDDLDVSSFSRIDLRRLFCADVTRTCYRALGLESSSWNTAGEMCRKMGLELFTVNTELEWHQLQHWFSGDLFTLNLLRKYLMVFLGLKLDNNLQWEDGAPLGFQVWQHPFPSYSIPDTIAFSQGQTAVYRKPDVYLHMMAGTPQPSFTENNCVASVVYSSTQIKWITVPCNRSFENVLLLCESKGRYMNETKENVSASISRYADPRELPRSALECQYGWINVDELCYNMVYLTTARILMCGMLKSICESVRGLPGLYDPELSPATKYLALYLKHWLDFDDKEILYLTQQHNLETVCTATSFVETEHPTIVLSSGERTSGLVETGKVFCEASLKVVEGQCLSNQHACGDGTCIVVHHYCDGIVDCLDGTDETSCDHVCEVSSHGGVGGRSEKNCFETCFPEICTCSDLYFHCEKSAKCVPASKLCDDHMDCPEKEDELFCGESIGGKRNSHSLPDSFSLNNRKDADMVGMTSCATGVTIKLSIDYLPSFNNTNNVNKWDVTICERGLTRCFKGTASHSNDSFPFHSVCLFELTTSTNALKHCSNGDHLHGCTKHQCPSDFKCRLSYCVPHHYVCNGRVDCPGGEDEEDCPKVCPGLLRCRHDGVCVHPNHVNDMTYDCSLSHDDEMLRRFDECPKIANCRCLGRSLVCLSSNLTAVPNGVSNFKTISLGSNKIQRLSSAMSFSSLIVFNLSDNSVTSIRALKLKLFPSLVSLLLAQNKISRVPPNAFIGLGSLRYLNLSSNSIGSISEGAFNGLISLSVLDLSQNVLSNVMSGAFADSLQSLQQFVFKKNVVTREVLAEVNSFPNLQYFFVDLASYCPYVFEHIQCNYSVRNYISCCRLINSLPLVVVVFIFVVTSMLLNSVCVVFVSSSTGNLVAKLLAISQHGSDSLIVLFFTAFAVANIYFHDTYMLNRPVMQQGIFCRSMASMLAVGDGLSLISTVLNSVQHFYVVAYPLKNLNACLKWHVATFSISAVTLILTSFLPGTINKDNIVKVPCFVFPVAASQTLGTIYFLSIYVSLNLVTRLGTILFTTLTLRKLKQPEKTHLRKSGGGSVKAKVIQKSYVYLSVNIFGLVTFWIVQAVLLYIPVDSGTMAGISLSLYVRCLLNPTLYTITTRNFITRFRIPRSN